MKYFPNQPKLELFEVALKKVKLLFLRLPQIKRVVSDSQSSSEVLYTKKAFSN